jgi:hypothetical protein
MNETTRFLSVGEHFLDKLYRWSVVEDLWLDESLQFLGASESCRVSWNDVWMFLQIHRTWYGSVSKPIVPL